MQVDITRICILCALLFAGGTSVAFAAAEDCPEQGAIRAANRAADAFFRAHVVQRASIGAPDKARPARFVTAESFGALGDGVSDDTAALQRALDAARKVWLAPHGVYRVTQRLTLPSRAELASDGTATLLMARGPEGFSNALGERTDSALHSKHGTGLLVAGDDIGIRDLFLVKEFEDDRYVIGIDVRASRLVRITRVRVRGFSLAPGIITIRSSDEVEVSSTLIHDSCTASTTVPRDVPSFQLTGISIDDTRVGDRGSTRVVLDNNVIARLRMVPRTARRVQTDGINFAAIGRGSALVVRNNYVADVDEALDIFGADIEVSGNRLQASGTVVKLIHGAYRIRIRDNDIDAGPAALAFGVFTATPADEARRVRDIVIEKNRIRVAGPPRAAIGVDAQGAFPPMNVVVRNNLFEVTQCARSSVSCHPDQCEILANRQLSRRSGLACPD
jgi:hypothetical protein